MRTSFLLICMLSLSACAALGQESSEDPGHKMFTTVSDVKFSVPKDFVLEPISNPAISFLSWRKYNLAEFVAVSAPKAEINESYLEEVAAAVAKQMFPKQADFRWKLVGPGGVRLHKSKFQTGEGDLKGINKSSGFVQISFVCLNVNGRSIVAGYITSLGQNDAKNPDAKFLFDLDGPGGASMPGLYALAHIIASITGEKYTDINPGIELIGSPGS